MAATRIIHRSQIRMIDTGADRRMGAGCVEYIRMRKIAGRRQSVPEHNTGSASQEAISLQLSARFTTQTTQKHGGTVCPQIAPITQIKNGRNLCHLRQSVNRPSSLRAAQLSRQVFVARKDRDMVLPQIVCLRQAPIQPN